MKNALITMMSVVALALSMTAHADWSVSGEKFGGGGVKPTGPQSMEGPLTITSAGAGPALDLTATPAGSKAIKIAPGAKLELGTESTANLTSDFGPAGAGYIVMPRVVIGNGGDVNFASIAALGVIENSGATFGGDLVFGDSLRGNDMALSDPWEIKGLSSGATSAIPVIRIKSQNAVDANDLLVTVANQTTDVFSVDKEGDTVASGMLQFKAVSAGAPAAGDCDNDAERGRMLIDTTGNRLYVCNGATRGWDYVTLSD